MLNGKEFATYAWIASASIFLLSCGKAETADVSKIGETVPKESNVEMERQTYLSGAKAVDYAPTFTGFVLKPFSQKVGTTLSGGVLLMGKNTLTGSFLNENDVRLVRKDGKWVTLPSDGSGSQPQASVELKFVEGFTKMRYAGGKYAFAEDNLSMFGNRFDFELFLTDGGKIGYVLAFENADEKRKRQEVFDEYRKKAEEINEKYLLDSKTRDYLNSELKKAYGIQ